jgi:anti-anti-sigma factor
MTAWPTEPSSAADEFVTVTALPSAVDGVWVLQVAGEVELSTIGWLRERLREAVRGAHRAVVLDCTRVSFLAACGVGLLVEIADEARAGGVTLRLVVQGRRLLRVLEATGADGRLPVAATVAEAVAQCSGRAPPHLRRR